MCFRGTDNLCVTLCFLFSLTVVPFIFFIIHTPCELNNTMKPSQGLILIVLLFTSCNVTSFILTRSAISFPHRTRTLLRDLSEWRDLIFEIPLKLQELTLEDYQEGPLRQICILPFPLDDTLLIGETKELCLYEERFHKLFEKCTQDHASIVAMGMMAPPAGILQTMALCEVESFRTMEGNNGFTNKSILVTIRVVGRGCLVQLEEDDETAEYLKGWVTELWDDTSSEKRTFDSNSLRIANELADKLEDDFEAIVRLESKISELEENDVNSEEGISEAAMKIRMIEAEIESMDDEDSSDDEDSDEEEGEEDIDSRRRRFQESLRFALATDNQGYKISSQSDSDKRSLKDLTALSWAYFCSEENDTDILSYRLRALEITDICERLKLARTMMSELRAELRNILKSNDSSSGES